MDPTRNQPPVALRITRPYPSEDALLAAESNAFTRTGVVLLGAPSKPSGVVLRFEMCLNDGTPVMRGEGRVVGFKPADASSESALMLRFTKLDVKSKELLDRAVALREERRSLAPPAAAPLPPPPPKTSAPPPPPSAAPPPPSVAPTTDREPEPISVPLPPVVVAEPTPAPSVDVEPAMDVDDLDLKSADESDLTEQAPPVAMRELAQTVRERMPVPQPSPARVPEPHRDPPVEHAPARHAPERAPMIPHAPERMPAPQPSPEPRVRAEGTSDALARVRERRSDSFTPSLDRPQRDSALERLRARKS